MVIKLVREHFKLTFSWNTSAINYQCREDLSLNGTFWESKEAMHLILRRGGVCGDPLLGTGGLQALEVGRKGPRRE